MSHHGAPQRLWCTAFAAFRKQSTAVRGLTFTSNSWAQLPEASILDVVQVHGIRAAFGNIMCPAALSRYFSQYLVVFVPLFSVSVHVELLSSLSSLALSPKPLIRNVYPRK